MDELAQSHPIFTVISNRVKSQSALLLQAGADLIDATLARDE
jgi:hypothetical protein